MNENEIAKIIVDCAFDLHRRTRPGMLERVYRDCLEYLLLEKGLAVAKEKSIDLEFEKLHIESAYRLDLLVGDKVIVEIKATSNLMDAHVAQLLTYLKLTDKKLGLVINFNSPLMKDGIRRLINGKLERI